MPVKNVEEYIRQSIDSILTQTYKNFELLIIDDSTDNTPMIIKSYNDTRIKHILFAGNISQKLNYAVKKSNGNYIARMDGDDISHAYKLEKQLNFLQNSGIDILGTNFYCIDNKGKIILERKFPEKHNDIEYMMPIITSILHPTMILLKRVIIESGGYNENINCAEDTEFFLRCINKYTFYNLQEPLYNYRIIDNSNSKNKLNDTISYEYGKNYILNSIKRYPNMEKQNIFRLGMLEYYKNDVSLSRKIFATLLFEKNINKTKLLRYLFPSLFGNFIIKVLRDSGFLSALNRSLSKLTGYDSNIIKAVE